MWTSLFVSCEDHLCLLPCSFHERCSQFLFIFFLWPQPIPSGSCIASKIPYFVLSLLLWHWCHSSPLKSWSHGLTTRPVPLASASLKFLTISCRQSWPSATCNLASWTSLSDDNRRKGIHKSNGRRETGQLGHIRVKIWTSKEITSLAERRRHWCSLSGNRIKLLGLQITLTFC